MYVSDQKLGLTHALRDEQGKDVVQFGLIGKKNVKLLSVTMKKSEERSFRKMFKRHVIFVVAKLPITLLEGDQNGLVSQTISCKLDDQSMYENTGSCLANLYDKSDERVMKSASHIKGSLELLNDFPKSRKLKSVATFESPTHLAVVFKKPKDYITLGQFVSA